MDLTDSRRPPNGAGIEDIDQLVREVLSDENLVEGDAHALAPDADLREAGLTSLRMVQLVMAIEERLGTSIPDESLSRSRFATIVTVTELVGEISASAVGQPPAPRG